SAGHSAEGPTTAHLGHGGRPPPVAGSSTRPPRNTRSKRLIGLSLAPGRSAARRGTPSEDGREHPSSSLEIPLLPAEPHLAVRENDRHVQHAAAVDAARGGDGER